MYPNLSCYNNIIIYQRLDIHIYVSAFVFQGVLSHILYVCKCLATSGHYDSIQGNFVFLELFRPRCSCALSFCLVGGGWCIITLHVMRIHSGVVMSLCFALESESDCRVYCVKSWQEY